MSDKASIQDVFLRTVRQTLEESSVPSEAMETPYAKQLLSALTENAAAVWPQSQAAQVGARPAVPDLVARSREGLLAAISVTFDLAELKAPETVRESLLSFSDLVMIGGNRRLRLRDQARADILDSQTGADAYRSILQQARAIDLDEQESIAKDPIRLPSAWLRAFLSGNFKELRLASSVELKAALEARERLQFVKTLGPKTPSVEDLSRRAELAELLEPLQLLIGASWDGRQNRDRFVGRLEELKSLRAFVDELSSKTRLEGFQRSLSRVQQAVLGTEKPGIQVIEARGGMGKSTLLAKFLLDHAMGQERPFPFAYLDFDRASLDPQRPGQLLIEIARQVGLQFPEARPKLNQVVDNIRAEFLGTTIASVGNTGIRDPFAAFVEIVREHITYGKRAFLLVLDTMEAVQWDSSALDKLASLIDEFRAKGLDELKVVACGRADIPELRRARGIGTARKNIELGPLKMSEARELAQALGATAIGPSWNSDWSQIIAGPSKDAARREPLAVRVAVDLVVRASPEERDKVVAEIAKEPLEEHEDFVARIYFKRVVNHVRDPLARKLAWPGLVLRRVDVEIIRGFLGPLCGIGPDQAQAALDALSQEVWMVSREGNALRHRQDLRAHTLPLMRNAEPERFKEIAEKAVEYFGRYRSQRTTNAEWIYHRLLAGEAPERVAQDWQDDFLPLLARAAEDFPRKSAAASYLASRTAQSRLSPSRIRDLRPADALFHLSRTSSGSFALDDLSFDSVTQDVGKRTTTSDLESSLQGWARALWIKTGAWQKVSNQRISPDALRNNQVLRAHLFWVARIAATFPDSERQRLLHDCLQICSENLESVGVRSAVQIVALARIAGAPEFAKLDRVLGKNMLSVAKPSPAPSTLAALRTAVVFGDQSRGPALQLWLLGRRRGTSDRVRTPSISLAEINALVRINPGLKVYFGGMLRRTGELPARFTNPDVVGNADRAIEGSYDYENQTESNMVEGIASMFACRDEDWILPVAYAAARAYGQRPSGVLAKYLTYYNRENSDAPVDKPATDMVTAMRNADEAGDLGGFANFVLTECKGEARTTEELEVVLTCRTAWRQAISQIISTGDGMASRTSETRFFSTVLSKVRDVIGSTEANKERVPIPSARSGDRAPEPGPIQHPDDPQKGRWGGQSQRDGREVRVVIDSVERDIFYFSVIVASTDYSPLQPPVIFHLHDTFPRSVVTIRKVENQQAILREWNAYGVFAIGVQVKNAAGKWIALEIDLADAPDLPRRFLSQ